MQSSSQQEYVASAEPPLDEDRSDGATSATTEHVLQLAPPRGDSIKHSFVHLNTHEKWIGGRSMHIDVNLDLKVRVNGGPWHGSAKYGSDASGYAWELVFHFKADESRMKKVRFHQIPNTQSFLHIAPVGQSSYNAMLILEVD